MILPEVDNRARQTSIHHNDPNPFFDQHFKFPVSHDELSEKTLLLQVYDYDRLVEYFILQHVVRYLCTYICN